VNLLKSPFRRTTAVVAGSLLGMAGMMAFAAPASAHAADARATASCVSDEGWTVDWSVGQDFETDAKVAFVVVTDGEHKKPLPIDGDLHRGQIIPTGSDVEDVKRVHGTTAVSKSVDKVQLTVVLEWPDGYTNNGKGEGSGPPFQHTVNRPDQKCDTPNPTPSTTTSASPSPSASVSASPSTSPTPAPTGPVVPVPVPSSTDEPAEFEPIIEFDCDTMSLGIDNPADGATWDLKFETSKGEVREVSVKPGEKKVEKFSATEGFSVKFTLSVTFEGKTYSDFVNVDYVHPADCDNSGSGGGLPVTGAAAGGIAGGAAALLAAGIVLFVMARRRKVKFTA
jgi:hypothetical protein